MLCASILYMIRIHYTLLPQLINEIKTRPKTLKMEDHQKRTCNNIIT